MTGHTGTVHSLDFSKDGAVLASSASDNTVCIWNYKAADTKAIVISRNEIKAKKDK